MIIKAYNSTKMVKTTIYHTAKIESAPDIDDADFEDFRELIQTGDTHAMCNFSYYDDKESRHKWIAIPWDFVISIKDNKEDN